MEPILLFLFAPKRNENRIRGGGDVFTFDKVSIFLISCSTAKDFWQIVKIWYNIAVMENTNDNNNFDEGKISEHPKAEAAEYMMFGIAVGFILVATGFYFWHQYYITNLIK